MSGKNSITPSDKVFKYYNSSMIKVSTHSQESILIYIFYKPLYRHTKFSKAGHRLRSLSPKIHLTALDYQSMLEMSYDTRGNRYKLVPKLWKYELRKHFFVNRVVKLWSMLHDEVASVSSVTSFKRHLDGFWLA